MSETSDILSAEQLKRWYGSFYDRSPKLHLDGRNVPEKFWPLLPYTEFWGIADDLTRENLVKQAPAVVQNNLKEVVAAFGSSFRQHYAISSERPQNLGRATGRVRSRHRCSYN